MAKLKLPCGYLTLRANRTDTDIDCEWLPTKLIYRLDLMQQSILVESRETFSILLSDYIRLIEGVRSFIQSRINPDEDFDDPNTVTIFEFVPLELGFVFVCLEGDVDENLRGSISIRLLVNLQVMEKEHSSSYIGGEFEVDSESLLEFLSDLELELQV